MYSVKSVYAGLADLLPHELLTLYRTLNYSDPSPETVHNIPEQPHIH